MKLELYFILMSVAGFLIRGRVVIERTFRTISFNFLSFLSLFGGLMILGCLTPAIIDFFKESREKRLKLLLWVGGLSTLLLLLPTIDFFRWEAIQPGTFGKLYFKLKINPLLNFSTAIALSIILGFIGSKRRFLEKEIREFGEGIEEIIKKFILPGFMLATPGILSTMDLDRLLEATELVYLKNIGVFIGTLLLLSLFFRSILQRSWSRAVYKILFIGILISPILTKAPPTTATIFIFFLTVILTTTINPKVPPMVALGLFAEITDLSTLSLGGIIVLYFSCSGVERLFCSAFHSWE